MEALEKLESMFIDVPQLRRQIKATQDATDSFCESDDVDDLLESLLEILDHLVKRGQVRLTRIKE